MIGCFAERDDHRRRDERAGDPVILVQLKELLEVEARHRHDGGAGREPAVHEHLHAVDVEERQHRDDRLVFAQVSGHDGLHDVRRPGSGA